MKVSELFPKLTEVIREDHEGMEEGHGFYSHVYRVASLALKFGEELGVNKMAAAAGLCHNADRLLLTKRGMHHDEDALSCDVEEVVRGWLTTSDLSPREEDIVVNAVLRHTRPNEDDDDPVTIVLKDADRVVNLALDVVIRSGQFRKDLPVIDFVLLLSDKRGRYNHRKTIIADLVDCIDWAKPGRFGVRTMSAQAMIKKRARRLTQFFEDYVEQLEEEGFLPLPIAAPDAAAVTD